MKLRTQTAVLLLSLFGAASAGCASREEWDRFWDQFSSEKRGQPDADALRASKSKALQGTIGPLVTVEGMRLSSVRGFGLVVDLAGTGGRDAPEDVKKYLQKEVRRRQEIGLPGTTTEELFSSLDCAVVEVTGLIPAAARKGDHFDVVVRAMGTECRSLVGGRLFLCDLKQHVDTVSGVIEGKTLATAEGPIFASIFDKEGKPLEQPNPRQDQIFVLGGGEVKEPRKVRLVLNDPSYSTVRQIVNRINSRYTPLDPVANGRSPSFVDLAIPDEYRPRKRLFLERVMHTTLMDNPNWLEQRAVELTKEIGAAEPDYESIGLAWEAIGKIALPHIKPLYASPSAPIRYYAGRTGLRMSDLDGMEVVARAALDPNSRFRAQAIDELGFAPSFYSAGEYLRTLTGDRDQATRIRAYRALRRRNTKAIESRLLDRDNLTVDVIDCEGPQMIYIQRLGSPRIAVFGKATSVLGEAIAPRTGKRRDWRLQTLITAKAADRQLTVLYTNKRTGKQSPPLSAPRNVGELITFLGGSPRKDADGKTYAGLAVPFSEVVEILYTFCDLGAIPAKFVVEKLDDSDDAQVDETKPRPESEIESDSDSAAESRDSQKPAESKP